MSTFFQIGTHKGHDTFFEFVLKYNPDNIFLVEPQSQHFPIIRDCYKEYNYKLIEGVIHEKESGLEVDLFLPDNDKRHTTSASLEPMIDWEHDILPGFGVREDKLKKRIDLEPIKVKAYNFNDICKEEKITEIDLLVLDTEGYDNIIIDSINFDKVKIKCIIFEIWPFDKTCYKDDNPNLKLLGKSGTEHIKNKLKKLGYKYREFKDTDKNYIFELEDSYVDLEAAKDVDLEAAINK